KYGSAPITSIPARNCTIAAKIGSKSRSVLACTTWSCSPSLRAAACRSLDWLSEPGKVGLRSAAATVAVGTNSCNISTCFCTSATLKLVTPVTLPPGRSRLATSPTATGSTATGEDDRNGRGLGLCRECRRRPSRDNQGHLTSNQPPPPGHAVDRFDPE